MTSAKQVTNRIQNPAVISHDIFLRLLWIIFFPYAVIATVPNIRQKLLCLQNKRYVMQQLMSKVMIFSYQAEEIAFYEKPDDVEKIMYSTLHCGCITFIHQNLQMVRRCGKILFS